MSTIMYVLCHDIRALIHKKSLFSSVSLDIIYTNYLIQCLVCCYCLLAQQIMNNIIMYEYLVKTSNFIIAETQFT